MTDEQLLAWCDEQGYDEYLAPLLKSFDLDEDDLNALDIQQIVMGKFKINGILYEVIEGSYREIASELEEDYRKNIEDDTPVEIIPYVDWVSFIRDYSDEALENFSYADEIEFNNKTYCYIEYDSFD